jgi:hypothetical protein
MSAITKWLFAPARQSHLIISLWKLSLMCFLIFHNLTILITSLKWDIYSQRPQIIYCTLIIVLAIVWLVIPRRVLSLLLFFLWGFLYSFDPYSVSSETALIGWLLLSTSFISQDTLNKYFMQNWLWLASWIVLSFSYFNSGLMKLFDSSWRSGDTLNVVFTSRLTSIPHLWGLAENLSAMKALSWLIILSQIAMPLALFGTKLRRFFWWSQITFHLISLIILPRVDQVSWAFLTFHIYVFDSSLIGYSSKKFQKV